MEKQIEVPKHRKSRQQEVKQKSRASGPVPWGSVEYSYHPESHLITSENGYKVVAGA